MVGAGRPNPHAENGSSLTAIDCPAPGRCEAVGDYDYADIGQSVMAYGYDGTTWIAQSPVNPVGQEFNAGDSVSCVNADACMTVGIWTGNFGLPFAEYWDGTTSGPPNPGSHRPGPDRRAHRGVVPRRRGVHRGG